MTRMGDTTEIMGRILHNGEVESRAREAEAARSRAASERSAATMKSINATRQARDLQDDLDAANATVEKQKAALAERDALIREWMHSNEAFKRLARQYGKSLNITDEKRTSDFHNHVANVSEEDPKFANTALGADIRAKLKIRANVVPNCP